MKLEPQKQEPKEGRMVSTKPAATKTDRSVLKKIQITCGVLVVVLVVFGVRFVGTMKDKQTLIADQKAKITTLQGTLTEYQDANAKKEADEQEAAKGNRTIRDNQLASAFAKKLLTYQSYEEYRDIRNWLKETHQVADTDALLTSFFPDLPKETVEATNMTFEGATSYQIKSDGEKRSYFTLCKVSNRTEGNSGNGHVGLFYTIDEAGTFSGISAYTLVR